MLAALIIVAGTIGDRVGRRRMLVVGLAVFTAASAACALATDDPQLVAFRAVQGVGAALMAPLALAILVDAYPPERRPWAIGIWAAVAGIGFGAGPIVGGALIAAFDWSAIFWVNVPMGVVGIVLTLGFVRESRDPTPRPLDLPGAVLGAGALFCLTFGLVQTERHAWDSAPTLAFLAAGAVLLARLPRARGDRARADAAARDLPPAAVHARHGHVRRALRRASPTALFYVSLFFQDVKGWSALQTGVSWLAMNVPFLVASLFAGRRAAPLRRAPGSSPRARRSAASRSPASRCSDPARGYVVALPSFIALGARLRARRAGRVGHGHGARSSPSAPGSARACSTPPASSAPRSASPRSSRSARASRATTGPTTRARSGPRRSRSRRSSPGARTRRSERQLGAAQVPAASDAFVAGMRAALLAAGALALAAAVLIATSGSAHRRAPP